MERVVSFELKLETAAQETVLGRPTSPVSLEFATIGRNDMMRLAIVDSLVFDETGCSKEEAPPQGTRTLVRSSFAGPLEGSAAEELFSFKVRDKIDEEETRKSGDSTSPNIWSSRPSSWSNASYTMSEDGASLNPFFRARSEQLAASRDPSPIPSRFRTSASSSSSGVSRQSTRHVQWSQRSNSLTAEERRHGQVTFQEPIITSHVRARKCKSTTIMAVFKPVKERYDLSEGQLHAHAMVYARAKGITLEEAYAQISAKSKRGVGSAGSNSQSGERICEEEAELCTKSSASNSYA
ncbi:hypothetical protein CEUSTIGMA_g6361.t1 [Chlamydomonas eustigma]|uniref:Uncharacterized protein n=1 Tax=Chlamydomonas eustigma TaxID=1157962 RepID=A0A250X7R0_9CHLO|nr:hypothetical protein CEUSTIGMA_g6361.t1 [Chlamydomonas eustigma]|eukprot:GAX78922.1 hypothetical protein CEUSTIGMA_g6361.t1 [Chlamydomonas eustigma]